MRQPVGPAFSALRGNDPGLARALAIARRAAMTDCSVLITGETGTGKELVAQAIHQASPRRQGPMLAINCGAIARDLIGSELFGHERGSFTGAATTRDGVFVQAHGGTLFLDELGELPLEQQPHLLRVLETRQVRRLGGNRDRTVDVRVVAATNRLDAAGSGSLRLDLFHRVATVIVHLPPLRERPGDIPLLVHTFMDELTPELGEHTISEATMRELERYPWPGNVRELRQSVQRAMTLCAGELTADALLQRTCELPPPPMPLTSPVRFQPPCVEIRVCESRAAVLRPIDILIRDAMCEALEQHTSMRRAAQSLGLAKSTFADWARRLGIVLEQR